MTIRLAAHGLPPGLSLDQTTGTLSGRPRRTGTFSVQETAQDAEGSSSSTTFTVIVGAAPRIRSASVSGLRTGRPRVSFTVSAGRAAPEFQQLSISLPSGLRFASTRGVTLKARGVRHPRFRTRLWRGVLQVTPRRSSRQLSLILAAPALRADPRRHAQARRRGRRRVELGVAIVDAGAGTSRLQTRLKPTGSR
jgi:hypothetical protein